MTDAELKHLKERTLWPDDVGARDEAIDQLVDEALRLRGLIKEVERAASSSDAGDVCPWCDSERGEIHQNCRAFSTGGEVR